MRHEWTSAISHDLGHVYNTINSIACISLSANLAPFLDGYVQHEHIVSLALAPYQWSKVEFFSAKPLVLFSNKCVYFSNDPGIWSAISMESRQQSLLRCISAPICNGSKNCIEHRSVYRGMQRTCEPSRFLGCGVILIIASEDNLLVDRQLLTGSAFGCDHSEP